MSLLPVDASFFLRGMGFGILDMSAFPSFSVFFVPRFLDGEVQIDLEQFEMSFRDEKLAWNHVRHEREKAGKKEVHRQKLEETGGDRGSRRTENIDHFGSQVCIGSRVSEDLS